MTDCDMSQVDCLAVTASHKMRSPAARHDSGMEGLRQPDSWYHLTHIPLDEMLRQLRNAIGRCQSREYAP
jgi:hypothetical protein